MSEINHNPAQDRHSMDNGTTVITEEHIDNAIQSVKQDIKVWLMGTVLTSAITLAVPMVGVVFYLGSISTKLDSAFKVQTEQQTILANNRDWMDRRERVEESLVMWAKSKGYEPPEPAR